MSLNRNYNYKDVDMLLASKTIIESFKANLEELSLARTNWTVEYGNKLSAKIDDAIENYLGVDSKQELRDATNTLTAIQTPALHNVSFLKTQLEIDFNDDKKKLKEILKHLGFNTYLKAAQKKDQEALIQLLYSIKKNLSGKLKEEITLKGTNPALLEKITSYADELKKANISQETLKETTKSISDDAKNAFNEIYDEVIGICKIASVYYQYDNLKKELFIFSKAIKNMNAAKTISQLEE